MKIFFLITCFLVQAVTSYSQQNHHPEPTSREDYLQLSRKQRTAGYMLLGVGVAAVTIPIIIFESEPYFEGDPGAGLFSMLMGAVMIVASVPLLNSSDKNKRKAMSLSFKNETKPYIQDGNLLIQTIPSLSLKIGF